MRYGPIAKNFMPGPPGPVGSGQLAVLCFRKSVRADRGCVYMGLSVLSALDAVDSFRQSLGDPQGYVCQGLRVRPVVLIFPAEAVRYGIEQGLQLYQIVPDL